MSFSKGLQQPRDEKASAPIQPHHLLVGSSGNILDLSEPGFPSTEVAG